MPGSSREPLIIRLRENETSPGIDLPAELASALRSRYKPEQLKIAPSWAGGYDLSAGNHIGTIAYSGPAGGLRIIIEPKVPIANLFYMLTYAHELPDFGREVAPLVAGEDLFDLVVRIFIGQVDDIVRRGIHRGYVDFEEHAPHLRGRLLLAQQVRRGTVAVAFHQRTNEFTADLLENRILRGMLSLLARVPFADRELSLRIRRTLSAFAEASPVSVGPADCGRVVYTRLNERYRSPINLARLFLKHLSLEGRSGETPFVTFLVPMYQLFELFVARLLERELAALPRYSVHPQETIWLDEARQLKARPDMVLNRDGRPLLVLDTKYKVYNEKPAEADIYQMVTYCHTLHVERAILIYPSDHAPDDRYRMRSGVWLESRTVSLMK